MEPCVSYTAGASSAACQPPLLTVMILGKLITVLLQASPLVPPVLPVSQPSKPWKISTDLLQASPIVRVAVESARPAEMPQLEEGLRLLNRADPFVDVSVLDSGEYVIGAAGAAISSLPPW